MLRATRSHAGWLLSIAIVRRLRRNKATLLFRKTKEQRTAVAHLPSFMPFSNGPTVYLSPVTALSSSSSFPSTIRLSFIISENRVHRPSSKQFPTSIDSLAYTTASPFESLVSSFASTSSSPSPLHRDRPPLRLR